MDSIHSGLSVWLWKIKKWNVSLWLNTDLLYCKLKIYMKEQGHISACLVTRLQAAVSLTTLADGPTSLSEEIVLWVNYFFTSESKWMFIRNLSVFSKGFPKSNYLVTFFTLLERCNGQWSRLCLSNFARRFQLKCAIGENGYIYML